MNHVLQKASLQSLLHPVSVGGVIVLASCVCTSMCLALLAKQTDKRRWYGRDFLQEGTPLKYLKFENIFGT